MRQMFISILLLSTACSAFQDRGPVRNVVVIVGDDHSAEVLGCYENPIVRTPNLDQLAFEGVRFDRAYANSPVCTPSRQSIITGKLPHAVGVTLLATPLAESETTIADYLGSFGFSTGAIGKMHFNSSLKHGFDYRVDTAEHQAYLKAKPGREVPSDIPVRPPWKPFQDPARIWLNADVLPGGLYDDDSEGTFFTREAIGFLERNRHQRFCLWLSYHEPHSPFSFPVEFAGRYRPAEMPLPAVGPEDERWIPSVFRDLTRGEKKGIVASYYTSVEYLDRNVGRVLDALDRLGLSDETLVIYIGDQGYLLGHHGRFEKHTMWEPAVRAPLLMKAPGLAARWEPALVEFIDLFPSILDYLGIEPLKGLQGKSLKPLLDETAEEHRDHVFSEFLADNTAMIRTTEWKYVFATGQSDLSMGYETGQPPPGPIHRLYDVRSDREEFHNLASEPAFADVVRHLQNLMLARFEETDPRAPSLPEGLTIEGQLTWFCQPPETALD